MIDETDFRRIFEGTIVDRWTTPGGNLMLRLGQTKIINKQLDAEIKLPSKIPEMNFLVPRRLPRITQECKDTPLNTSVRLILKKESRSGKFTVRTLDYTHERVH